MSQLIHQLAIWMPTSMIVWVLMWCTVKLFGGGRSGGTCSARTPGTWPLMLVLVAGAVFGLLGGSIEFALGDRPWRRLAAGVVAAVVSTWAVPRLWMRLFAAASPASHPDQRRSCGDE